MKESGRENFLNVKRENWKREHGDHRAPAQKWCVEREQGRVGEKGEEEKGQTAGDLVLSRHLAEANRDEEEKRIWGEGKGRNLAEERKEDQQTTVVKEMIAAAEKRRNGWR